MYPAAYLYSKEHEWIRVESDQVVLGITAFAQDELGEVVYVDLPEVGQSFDIGDEIGSIESVKAVAEVYTPIAGEIVEINEMLESAPETVNSDPHDAGWLVRIRFSGVPDLNGLGLMSAEEYVAFTKAESD